MDFVPYQRAQVALTALCVLRDDEGRVLLVKQAYGRRRWALPGGVVEVGEAPWVAAVRECLEEAGLEVVPTGIVSVTWRPDKSGGPTLALAFSCELADPSSAPRVVPQPGEIELAGWYAPGSPPEHLTPTATAALAALRGEGVVSEA